MEELIKELEEKAGLSREQASKAIKVLTDKIKSQVPESLHGMISNFLGSAKEEGESLLDKMKNFGDLFGGDEE